MEDEINRLRRLGNIQLNMMTPFITPKMRGCVNINNAGQMCLGSDKLDKSVWCDNCMCYYKEDQ